MPGPAPKPSAARQRRNSGSAARLIPPEDALWLADRQARKVPELPPWQGRRRWHPRTLAWWEETWRSPMATLFYRVDFYALWELAELKDDLCKVRDAAKRKAIMAEIRMHERKFGQSPLDRTLNRFETDPNHEAQPAPKRRRASTRSAGGQDPREMLRVVS
jgi:hypothetical protein